MVAGNKNGARYLCIIKQTNENRACEALFFITIDNILRWISMWLRCNAVCDGIFAIAFCRFWHFRHNTFDEYSHKTRIFPFFEHVFIPDFLFETAFAAPLRFWKSFGRVGCDCILIWIPPGNSDAISVFGSWISFSFSAGLSDIARDFNLNLVSPKVIKLCNFNEKKMNFVRAIACGRRRWNGVYCTRYDSTLDSLLRTYRMWLVCFSFGSVWFSFFFSFTLWQMQTNVLTFWFSVAFSWHNLHIARCKFMFNFRINITQQNQPVNCIVFLCVHNIRYGLVSYFACTVHTAHHTIPYHIIPSSDIHSNSAEIIIFQWNRIGLKNITVCFANVCDYSEQIKIEI